MKHKRIIISIAAFTMALLMLAGCKEKEKEAVAMEGLLRVGFLDGGDRFTGNASGAPQGIESEIAERVAEDTGLSKQFKIYGSLEELYGDLRNGELDVVFARIPETDGNLSEFQVSNTYGSGSLFLVTKRYNYMNDLSLINGGQVGVTVNTEPIADRVQGAESVTFKSYGDSLALSEDVSNGTLNAGIVNEREAVKLLDDERIQVQELFNSPKESYVAAMQKNSGFTDAVNNAIYSYRAEQIGLDSPEEPSAEEEN